MQMKSVFSSHVDKIGYDETTGELHVVFQDGKHAIYSGVPGKEGSDVVNAASVGSAMHQLIRGKYAFRYAGDAK